MFPRIRLCWQIATALRQQERAHRDCLGCQLAYNRICRDMLEQFLIALDQPEIHDELRARLAQSLRFYRDEIAVMEEHVQ